MGIYLFWGDDEFAMTQAVKELRRQILDPDWESFNYDRIGPEVVNGIQQALNQAMTPPFGMGQRLVWLVETTIAQRCPEDLLAELERTLPGLPETTVLLLTSSSKPDGRLKSTKLLQKNAEIREFGVIPPWKTDLLVKKVREVAQASGVKLTTGAIEWLADAVGNDTRQLHGEMEKLRLYGANSSEPLDERAIAPLVTASTQNSLQLGNAIRQGKVAEALELVGDLLRQNEPALRIVNSLVTQFRTWLWVKLMIESGERNEQEIAKAAEIANPKRIYFLKQEVARLPLPKLMQTLPTLLELEAGLKRGAEELAILQTKVIELCVLCGDRG